MQNERSYNKILLKRAIDMCDFDFDWELHRRYDQFGIDFRYIPFVFDRKYVSDNIGEEETAYWTSDCPVFISAQTGRGKNFFLKD